MNTFKISLVSDSDYEEIVDWWKAHGWPPVAKRFLSNISFLVYDDQEKILASFLYLAHQFAWLEWTVGNPKVSRRKIKAGLEFLIQAAEIVAKESGCLVLVSLLERRSLIKLYKRLNFLETDRKMSFMMKHLE